MSAALKQAKVKSSALVAVDPATSHEIVKAEATLPLQISRVNGMTPLMHAVCDDSDDSVDVVRTLLDRGADINARRNDGFTALALAAFFGRTSIVKLLLERGADVRVVTRFGTSPAMWAKARGFREVVDLLRSVPQVAIISESQVPVIPEHDVALTPDKNQTTESAEKNWLDGLPLKVPRTLPEIHDPPPLIGPSFHPGRAFIARVTSDTRSLATLTFALFVTLGLAIFATYQIGGLLRDDGKKTVSTDNDLAVPPQAATAQPVENEPAPQESAGNQAVTVDLPNKAVPGPEENTTPETLVKPSIKALSTTRLSRSSISTPKRDTMARREAGKESAELETDSRPAPLTVEVSRDRNPGPAPVIQPTPPTSTQSAPLGITSSKPRTKVIQWP